MLDEEYRGFEDVLARLRKLPAAAGPANRIYELFRNLATSGAPKSIIGQLVRYTHSEVLSAEVACLGPHPGSAGVRLQFLYDTLCAQIRMHHTDLSDAIKCRPNATTRSTDQQGTAPEETDAHPDVPAIPGISELEAQLVWDRLSRKRLIPETYANYRTCASRFMRWLASENIPLPAASASDMERFLNATGVSELTKAAYRTCIRRFYDVLRECGLASTNPVCTVDWRPPKSTRKKPFRRKLAGRRYKSANSKPE